ncbi:MAG: diadenylate cyclase CdaA [Lachnospiraceae bacterium]|nr:diadenylate cyclase CdaA [Lachnospiraceae bacterium]MBQ6542638.1 diadenylate cyclase CdaA [Lachnospiraceae bacterium]MBQ7601854.1 diadenylate cyclase CdaA [Lachnospiraceae bacterium]
MLDKLFQWNGWAFKIGGISITITITGIIETIIFIVLVYYLIRFFQRTKAWNLLKGLGLLVLVYGAAYVLGFNNLTYLFKVLFSSILLAVIVIFQPEIRKALERLGTNNLIQKVFPGLKVKDETSDLSAESVEAIVHALSSMGRNHVGALIVIERKIMLDEYITTGITLDAAISHALLEQIFEKNTPLHDGAVIIRENRIVAATCYLPLSQEAGISKELGTRHRAALGISEMSDCIALVASEETGQLSFAVNGKLSRDISDKELMECLAGTREAASSETEKKIRLRGRRRRRK